MVESVVEFAKGYYILGGVGWLFGAAIMMHNLLRNKISFPLAVVGIVAAIYGGLLGTRLLFIAVHYPQLFREDLPLALAFWQGGLSWQGGPILGGIFFAVVMAIARKPIWENMGAVAPGIALAHAISRFACLANGCCYGAPTTVPWAIYSSKLHTDVHPTQLYSMAGETIVAAVLQFLWIKRPVTRVYLLPLYGVLLSTHRFFSEAYRGTPDGPELIPGLRFYQALSVLIFVACLGLIALIWAHRNQRLRVAIPTVAAVGATVFAFLVLLPGTPSVPASGEPMYIASAEQLAGANDDFPASQPVPFDNAPIILVATRTMFWDSLRPWIELRESQGYTVRVNGWDDTPTEREIKKWITTASDPRPACVLVIGDGGSETDRDAFWFMPTFWHEVNDGEIGPEYSYDAPYADFDGDTCPDVPIGRIPVQDIDQLKAYLAKVIEHETRDRPKDWYRTVLWTGAEGYNAEIDRLTTEMLEDVPSWMGITRIGGSAARKAGLDPQDNPFQFLDTIQNPAMFSFIAAHGAEDQIWTTRNAFEKVYIGTADLGRLKPDNPLGVLFLMACDTGRFDAASTEPASIAEEFLRHSGGPVSVVAATHGMHPMTNYYATRAMLDQLENTPDTIGEFFLRVQRNLFLGGERPFAARAKAEGDSVALRFLDPFEDSFTVTAPRLQRNESLMYHLLGDPAVSLFAPKPVDTTRKEASRTD